MKHQFMADLLVIQNSEIAAIQFPCHLKKIVQYYRTITNSI